MTELSIISGKSGRAAPRSLSTNKRSMQVMLNYSGASRPEIIGKIIMTELSIISGKSGRAASRSLSTNKRSMQVMLNYSGASRPEIPKVSN